MLVTALYVSLLLPAGEEGMAGLALTSALNLAGVMNWLVRQIADLEVGNVSHSKSFLGYMHQYTSKSGSLVAGAKYWIRCIACVQPHCIETCQMRSISKCSKQAVLQAGR